MQTHGTCPDCGHNGCLTTFADGNTYCHSCEAKTYKNRKEPDMSKEKTFTAEVKAYRNLTLKAVEKYGVSTMLSDSGEDYARLYPYPHATKKRILPKDFSDNKGFTNDHLFGMDKFNAGSRKTITIVEGEDDAPAAWQMLGGLEYVVANPGSKVSTNLLKNCHKYLDSFTQIIIVGDSDDAGRAMVEKYAAAFPNKVYSVDLTLHNDPQEYLANGAKGEFAEAWRNRIKYVPEFDTSTPDAYVKLVTEAENEEFISSGIQAFDDTHGGLFLGHVYLFQAPEGTGKTELFHFFEYNLLKNYPSEPFASCHLEETKKRTTLGWASYDLDKNVTRTSLINTKEEMLEVTKSISELTKNEQAHLFSIGTDEDPRILLDRIKYYADVCGCKYFFIEPIQDLAQQYDGPDNTERFLSKIAVGLSRIATEKNLCICIIAHENDEGLISDCRKLGKQASVVVRLIREIESPDDDVRNTTTLKSKKNRPTSYVGFGGQLRFEPETFKLKEL